MALSRLAAEFAAEIKLHDWSDAPWRADRAGHRRENDSPGKRTEQLDAHGTESVRVNVMWVTAQVLAHRDPNFDVYEYAKACGIGEYNTYGRRWGRGIEAGLRGVKGDYMEPGLLSPPVGGVTRPDGCTHPSRGSQERILGSGTGDYHCSECGKPMPIVDKPAQCISCKSATGRIEPDPVHGESWRCLDCGSIWGWVRATSKA